MAAADDRSQRLGLVVCRGEAFISARVVLAGAITGDLTLGLVKQTVYMLPFALATNALCASEEALALVADSGDIGAYVEPLALRVLVIVVLTIVALILTRIALRLLRHRLEEAEALPPAARARAHRSLVLVGARTLIALAGLGLLYVFVLEPWLSTIGLYIVRALLALRRRPGLLLALTAAIQPLNFLVPMGGSTASKLVLACLLGGVVQPVLARSFVASAWLALAKAAGYLIVLPAYSCVHLPVARALASAPGALGDLLRPLEVWLAVVHAFLLGPAAGGAADGGDVAPRALKEPEPSAWDDAVWVCRHVAEGVCVGSGAPAASAPAGAPGAGAPAHAEGTPAGARADAEAGHAAGMGGQARPAAPASARRSSPCAVLGRAAGGARRAAAAAWFRLLFACAAVCRLSLRTVLRFSEAQSALGTNVFWTTVIPGAEDKLVALAWAASVPADVAVDFARRWHGDEAAARLQHELDAGISQARAADGRPGRCAPPTVPASCVRVCSCSLRSGCAAAQF